jgi:hypothetical protein
MDEGFCIAKSSEFFKGLKGRRAKAVEIQPTELALLRVGNYDALTSVAAPPHTLKARRGELEYVPSFHVTFGSGFPTAAQAAVQEAVFIWSTIIVSRVMIEIKVDWAPLGVGVLGGARPFKLVQDQGNTLFPISLANKLGDWDRDPNNEDVVAVFNSNYPNWYFGIDASPPAGQVDLVTVALHEFGHGLGFYGSGQVDSDGRGRFGYDLGTGYPYARTVYDNFISVGATNPVPMWRQFFSTTQPSVELGAVLTGNDLFCHGDRAVAANGHMRPKVFGPSTFQQGSSFTHFDEATYPPGHVNSLMTPVLGLAEAIQNPGPVGFALLRDMGWD